jgi:hypothetical protein
MASEFRNNDISYHLNPMIILFPNGEERTSLNNIDEQPKLHLLRKPFHVLAYFIVGEPEGCQLANTYVVNANTLH